MPYQHGDAFRCTHPYSFILRLAKLCQLNRVQNSFDRNTLHTIISALVLSKLSYCSTIWSNTTAANIEKFQALQNFACRISKKTKKLENITPELREIKWLPVNEHRLYRDTVMAFRRQHFSTGGGWLMTGGVWRVKGCGERSTIISPNCFLKLPNISAYSRNTLVKGILAGFQSLKFSFSPTKIGLKRNIGAFLRTNCNPLFTSMVTKKLVWHCKSCLGNFRVV